MSSQNSDDLPEDLRVAEQAVEHVVECLRTAIGPPLAELSQNAAASVPRLLVDLSGAVRELPDLTAAAEGAVAPVRAELESAARRRQCAHDGVLELARQVHQVVPTMFGWGKIPDNDLQRQLASWAEQLRRLAPPAVRGFEHTLGLDYELAEAARERCRRSPSHGRIQLLEDNRAVVIDGQQVATSLRPDQFRFVRALAASYPRPISYRDICANYEVMEQNATRMRNSLPAGLAAFLLSGPRGYCFALPTTPG